ncbi:MAG: hypothetical protein KGQ66_02260 [Acidobacteriota bacterium]|nr:hypothetical protein [Acidobacteriota bacterium]
MKATVLAGAVVASAALLAACSSSSHIGVSAPAAQTSTSLSSSTTAGAPPLTPTVYDCGGGAYEPVRLLITCGVATSMATGVSWQSWTSTGAQGQGQVDLTGHGPTPATLELGQVVTTSSGPQFSQLTITWTGSSPDGHPVDTVKLATSPLS